MASAFPHHSQVDHTPRERNDVVLERETPIEALQTLSSETAQNVVSALSDEPATASELADAVDTSVQNAQYHLERLCEVDLVEEVDTWYSSRGRPMTVYALAAEQLVVDFGPGGQDAVQGDERQNASD